MVVLSGPNAPRLTTFVAGLALLIPASLGLLIAGVPTVFCPLPMVTIIPAFLLSAWRLHYFAVIVPVLLFFVWNRGLFRGEAMIPRRSYFLLAGVIVLDILYFVSGWKFGLEYEGAEYTRVVCVVNFAWATFLSLAFTRAWKGGSSFTTSLFLHWMMFAWLAWYAFPYLGELP
jgi:hypothetical protein